MLDKTELLERIKKYRGPQIPRRKLDQQSFEFFAGQLMKYDLPVLRSRGFYSLQEILALDSEVFLSHNGHIRIGMHFEDTVHLFEFEPGAVRMIEEGDRKYPYRSLNPGLSKYSYFFDDNPEKLYKGESLYMYCEMIEELFGLSKGTFQCYLVEAGYGLRVDRGGQIGASLQKILNRKIPVFIDRVDLPKSGKGKEVCIVSGFEI